MFELSYRLALSFSEKKEIDYSTASEYILRNATALGDILVKGSDVDFSTNLGTIPIIDFAYCMNYTKNILSSGINEDVFDFTEGDGELYFELKNDEILMRSSYHEGVIRVSFDEFKKKVDKLYTDIKEDMFSQYPDLKENKKFIEWYHRKL